MISDLLKNVFAKKDAESVEKLYDRHLQMPFPTGCRHCGKCMEGCLSKAITIDKEWTIDLGKCIFCMECVDACEEMGTIDAPDYSLTREGLIYSESRRPGGEPERLPREKIRSFGKSVAIREIDAGSCNACESEINCCSNPYYDMGRFGLKIVASPRHADVLLVTGPMTKNMALAAKRTYDAAPYPKLVIAAGACAISGAIFVEGDVLPDSTDAVLDADMYIIGCPPFPALIIRSILCAFGFIEPQ